MLKRKSKRVLSIVLAVAMIVGLFPIAAFADGGGENGLEKVSTAEAFMSAVSNEAVTEIQLQSALEISQDISVPDNKTLTIDLNGQTLTYQGSQILLKKQQTLNLTDKSGSNAGKLVLEINGAEDATSAIKPYDGATANVSNITVTTTGAAFFPLGKDAAVNIDNCIVEAKTYCVATNSGAKENFGVKISIANSKLTSEQACAVMLNIPGTLDMNNCMVTGSSQAVMVRAGKASISNCALSLNGTATDEYNPKEDWKSGTQNVPIAALVVGSQTGSKTAYADDAVCNVTNTTISARGENANGAVYVSGNKEGQGGFSSQLTVAGEKTVIAGDVVVADSTEENPSSVIVSDNAQVAGNITNNSSFSFVAVLDNATVSDPVSGAGVDNVFVENGDNTDSTVVALNVTAVKLYSDLATAVSEANANDTVQLLQNIAIAAGGNNNIVLNKPVKLFGNNHAITRTFNDAIDYEAVLSVQSSGVTIKDVQMKGLTGGASEDSAIYINANGTEAAPISIENCSFVGGEEPEDSNVIGILATYKVADYVNVTGCSFKNLKYATYFNDISNATISNNMIDGTRYTGIYIEPSKNVTVSNNILTNIATENYENPAYASGIYTGNTDTSDTSASAENIVITGNKVTLSTNNTNGVEVGTNKVAQIGNVQYETLSAAIRAAKSGDTVTLIDDITSDAFSIPAGVTLDGNGHKITYNSTDALANGAFITVNKDANNVTIKNATIVADNIKHGVQFYCNNGGELNNVTINGGDWTALQVNGATNVDVVDTVLNPNDDKDAYANIEYSMGQDVTSIPSLTIDDVSFDSQYPSIWVDDATVEAMKAAIGSGADNDDVRDELTESITNNNTSDINIVVEFTTGAPENVVAESTYEPPYTGKYSHEIFTKVGENGTISVDRYATEGDDVTITVSPDEAYMLDELTVTANGKEVEVKDNGDGTYTFKMPSADAKIVVTFAEDPDWEPEPEEPAMPFVDVNEGDWFYDVVLYAYENGLMTGTSADAFAPNTATTRGMIVSMLARLEGVTSAEDAGFADVAANDWYATAVNWAASVGVVNGYEDNTFRPNAPITREQMAAILYNYADYKGYDVSARADLSDYADAADVSSWAEDVLSWANAEGLINGMTATTIDPQGATTRAQTAAMFERFLTAHEA